MREALQKARDFIDAMNPGETRMKCPECRFELPRQKCFYDFGPNCPGHERVEDVKMTQKCVAILAIIDEALDGSPFIEEYIPLQKDFLGEHYAVDCHHDWEDVGFLEEKFRCTTCRATKGPRPGHEYPR